MPNPEFVERVGQVGATVFDGVAFRHVSPTAEPLSGTGARIHGGRWNPPNSYATLYLGTDRETVVREFHRMARKQGLDAADFAPRDICSIRVHLESVLDLTPADTRAALGLTDSLLVRGDATYCRAVGEAAHYLSLEGVLAPSATGEGTVLAVFLGRLSGGSRVELVDVERWDVPPPPSQ